MFLQITKHVYLLFVVSIMTKTRVPLHKKSAGQNTAVRASIPVTSMSEIAMDSSNVKLECVSNPAEGSGSRVDLSATVSCQASSINTFTSSGKLLLCTTQELHL